MGDLQRDGEYPRLTTEEEIILREVLKALHQIKHGYIQLVVQDSRVVQIDKMEKVRLGNRPLASSTQM